MTNAVLTVAALAILGSSATAVAVDYRLAGTIALDDDKYLALIEMPSGEQRLFRVGDDFEDGTVATIASAEVIVERPGDDLVLLLAGGQSGSTSTAESGPVVATIELSDQQMESLLALRGSSEKQLMEAFSESLGLPERLVVREVWAGQQTFSSLADALPKVRQGLLQGEAPHLFFEPGSGLDEVYLHAGID